MLPVLFIGHGSPINAIEDNSFTQSLKSLGARLTTTPKAILVISAHWLNNTTLVSTNPKPKTIHDFFGFPDELYKIQYPAPGAKELALKLIKVIPDIKEDDEMGLDHGAWAILKHIFPKADVPVFQLSIDYHKSMQNHFDLGNKLKFLRTHGVLIIGSGNVVHNLSLYNFQDNKPFDWAIEFNSWVKQCLENKDYESLINYKNNILVSLAVPEADHFIPLLYSLGALEDNEKMKFIYEEVTSSVSMLSMISEL